MPVQRHGHIFTRHHIHHRTSLKRPPAKLIRKHAAGTLLTPHACIDTVVLIGSIGGQYEDSLKVWFGVGAAVCFSVIWFTSLCAGARWLAPLFRIPLAWKVLDAAIWAVTWGIAAGMLIGF